MRTGTRTVGERLTGIGLAVLTGAVLAFLVAPILTIVPLSFSSGSFFFYPLPGLSLRWYQDFFASSLWLPALKNSLIIGISATGRGERWRALGPGARGFRHSRWCWRS